MAELKTFDSNRSDFAPYGFTVELWQPAKVPRADRHAEIEINYVHRGSITYIHGGRRFVVSDKQLVIFWAAIPHQVIAFDQADPYYVVTIPLRQAIDWQTPRPLLNALIRGEVLQQSSFNDLDWRQFATWCNDYESGASVLQEAMSFELRGKLLRLFHSLLLSKNEGSKHSRSINVKTAHALEDDVKTNDAKLSASSGAIADSHKKVESIVRYIAENFARKVSTEEIASSVGLHADYATALFRKSFGMTMTELITCYRVTQSQRLLMTTVDPISEVAHASGFDTLSRFNAAFKQLSGVTPSVYRRQIGTYLKEENGA